MRHTNQLCWQGTWHMQSADVVIFDGTQIWQEKTDIPPNRRKDASGGMSRE